MKIKINIISVQGLAGSFHEVAARKYFGDGGVLHYKDTFADVFAELANGQANFAIVAAENSRYGKIYEVEDLLTEYNFPIIDQIALDIHFCLLSTQNSVLGSVKHVYSQLPALVQCKDFLNTELSHAELVEHYDTAGACADVAKWGDPTKAALASEAAAEIYDLKILARNIEDDSEGNQTVFYVLAAS